MRMIAVVIDRMMERLLRRLGNRLRQRSQLFQHVVGRFDELHAVADQAVTAVREMAIDPTRHGEDVAILFHRMTGGNQGAAR